MPQRKEMQLRIDSQELLFNFLFSIRPLDNRCAFFVICQRLINGTCLFH
jgi:hypothetical protein